MTSQRYLKQGLPGAPTVERHQGDVASTPGNAWIWERGDTAGMCVLGGVGEERWCPNAGHQEPEESFSFLFIQVNNNKGIRVGRAPSSRSDSGGV